MDKRPGSCLSAWVLCLPVKIYTTLTTSQLINKTQTIHASPPHANLSQSGNFPATLDENIATFPNTYITVWALTR